jgi:lipopolysaccharide/colanic/teichoic acid biosynthesis glycosyltransferase
MKRMFDFVGSAIGLILLFPAFVIIAVGILLNMGSPVFFRQVRAGYNGRPFEIIKFRTMRDLVDQNGNPLPDFERLTPLGIWLRSSSLDELPELWNVMMGEMSLVGPRPLLIEYTQLYTDHQARRHDIRPGLTGWAQINGRNAISWNEKFDMDVWYVENRSFLLDLKVIFLTIHKVLSRDGISAASDATMPRFSGTEVRNDE